MLRRHPNKSTLAASATAVRMASSRLGSGFNSCNRSVFVAGRKPRAFVSFSSLASSTVLMQGGSSMNAMRTSLRAMQATSITKSESRRPLSTERRIEYLVKKEPPPSFSSSLRMLATDHQFSSLLRGLYNPSTHAAPPSSFPSLTVGRRGFSSQPAAPKPDSVKDDASKAAPASSSSSALDGNTTATSSSSSIPPPPRYVEEGFKPEDLKPEQGVEDPRKEENSPSTVGGVVRRYTIKGFETLRSLPGAVVSFTVMAGKYLVTFFVETIKNPSSLRERWLGIKKVVVEELHHYKLGSKVLWSDIKTSSSIVSRLLHGHTLSRRERRQLTRTTADLFRLVPFAFFVIVPFMELLLPFALKVFPNMLPSTFQDSLKTEENLKRELKVRLALAGFLKDTLGEIASKKKGGKEGEGEGGEESPNAALLTEFVEKARAGTHISTVDINRFARLFKDELTLDNMSRPQLAGMCVYMGQRPYGSDNFLRFQLRAKLRSLKEDDQRIVWEGVDNMTKAELREACRERGMRAYGLTQLGYRRQLQQWLDLSVNKEVPISLLILSRAFTLDSKFTDPAAAVADSISSLDKDVVNEVLLDVATGSELRNPDLRARKLESIERQNELIEEERKREEARRKKAEDEKKKADEEKKAKEKAAAEAAAAAAATAAVPAPATDAQLAQVDTNQVKDAIENAATMTGSGPSDGVPRPVPPAAESFPQEKVVTEAEVVSKAIPSMESSSSSAATTEQSESTAAAAIAAAAAQEVKEEQEEEAAKVEEQKRKKRELTVAEIKALRTLVKESSVDQEKTVLAQLKAELQAAATAKAAEAAAKEEEVVVESEAAPGTVGDATAATRGVEGKLASAGVMGEAAPLDLTLPPPTFSSNVPDAAAALAETTTTPAAGAVDIGEAPSTASVAPTATPKAEEVKSTPQSSPSPSSSTSSMDKALERMRLKVASMLDKLEVDIEKVESTIGDKLHMLDKDKDGVLTTAELSEVISHVLKQHTSEEEAQKIASTMDKDADGILTVQELMEWIEHREELLEELGDDDDNSSSSSNRHSSSGEKSLTSGAPPAVPAVSAAAPAAGAGASGGDGGRETK